MHPAIIIGTVRSLIVDVAVWGRYHVPQNVFLVSHAVDYENYFPGKSSYSHSKLGCLPLYSAHELLLKSSENKLRALPIFDLHGEP